MSSESTDLGEQAYEILTGNGDGPVGLLTIPVWAGIVGVLGLLLDGGAGFVTVIAVGGVVGFYLWGNGRLWGTKSADELLKEGAEHEATGEHEEALEYFLKAIEKDPTHAYALASAGQHVDELGAEQATTYLERALENFSDDASPSIVKVTCHERSRIALEQGNYGVAVSYADLALDIDPNMPDTHAVKAGALNELGEQDEAEYHTRRYNELEQRSEKSGISAGVETVA